MPWWLTFQYEEALPKDGSPRDRQCRGTLKVSDYMEGGDRISQATM